VYFGEGREGRGGEGCFRREPGRGRGGGRYEGRMEGRGGGVLAIVFVFRSCMAPQINLGCLETYRASGRLVITLLQGCIRVMSF